MSKVVTPVLIAGGGPVGMTLALNLARYGIRSLLCERNEQTTRHPKMDLTNGRSMELYRRLDLTEKLRDAGVPRENAFDISWITSLVGHELHRFHYPSANDATAIIEAENDGHHAREAGLRVSQIMIEPVLKRAIDESPLIEVRFGTRFERIVDQDDQGVTVEIVEEATGSSTTVACAYLAGCDGGGSRVRRQLGIELDGNMAVAGAHMVHFRTQDKALLQRWGAAWHLQTGLGTIISQNDDDIYTLQAWLIPGLDIDKMAPTDVLEGWVGKTFDYEILQANPWAANFVVAERYRSGRVVLAGDSAHQFVPTGGYGMNSGIADAAGLSWVLASRINGWGGDLLLDAYEEERRKTAWWHLEAAQRHMDVRLQIGGRYAEAGDLRGDDAATEDRRQTLARQIEAIGNAENESWGVELGYRYDGSPVICGESESSTIDPLTYSPSTIPGARLPHVFIEDGVSVHDLLGLWFSLVIVDDADSGSIEQAAAKLGIPLTVVRLRRPDLLPIYQRNLLLVRPDQHVAWRGDDLPAEPYAILERITGRALSMSAEASSSATARQVAETGIL
jgi:2-polyprenyl-6-methoxyphenol hydroxylase-like FAD-dependent oxidoreductase